MFLADFCMSPAANLLTTISSASSNYPSASFYLTCTGTNPFADSINTGYADCSTMQNSTNQSRIYETEKFEILRAIYTETGGTL